jgi:2-polyprenyl-3-methyl-5-hydroxy-6-metoxy-1,4-benzoquinol methylase
MNRGANTAEYWDAKHLREYSDPHDFSQVENSPLSYHKVAADLLRENESIFNRKTLLEIGCASGYFTAYLKSKVLSDWEIEGWDFAEVGIKMATDQCKTVNYKIRDVLVEPVDCQYGCICIFETLEHFEEPQNYEVLDNLLEHSEYVILSTVNTTDDCFGEHLSHYEMDTFEKKGYQVEWSSKLAPIQMPDGEFHYFIVLIKGKL